MQVMRGASITLCLSLVACGCSGQIDTPRSKPLIETVTPDPLTPEVPRVVVAEPLHRLNRTEYDNTVRELLGTSLMPGRAFPADTAVGGFDNVADALTLPASLFALYADAASTLAYDTLHIGPRYTQDLEARALGISGMQPGAAFENWGWSLVGRFAGTLTVPQAEAITVSILVGGGRTATAPVPVVSLLVDGTKIGSWTVSAPAATPQTFRRERPSLPERIASR